MSGRATLATAARLLTQLRHDPRTVGMVLVVPVMLVLLLKYVFLDRPEIFQRIGGPLLGLFPFVSMFVVTSITVLRERMSGTLERLMTMPLAKLDLLVGYAAAFAVLAALQVGLVAGVALGPLDLRVAGSPWAVVGLAIGNAALGMSLGLFASAFARTEFQAVQFLPAFVLPQLFLSGLFLPRDQMAHPLEIASYAMPLRYAYDALDRIARRGHLGAWGAADVAITLGLTALALVLGAATLRRRSP